MQNFVCAILLLFMDEESAFWTLHTICEDYVPEYYRPAMVLSSYLMSKSFKCCVCYFCKKDVISE
jgi:hypothetical protein